MKRWSISSKRTSSMNKFTFFSVLSQFKFNNLILHRQIKNKLLLVLLLLLKSISIDKLQLARLCLGCHRAELIVTPSLIFESRKIQILAQTGCSSCWKRHSSIKICARQIDQIDLIMLITRGLTSQQLLLLTRKPLTKTVGKLAAATCCCPLV